MNFSKYFLSTVAITVISAIVSPDAQAQMNENYVGVSGGASVRNSETRFELGVDGRYKIPGSAFSARASLLPLRTLSVQATATYDFPLGKGVGAYAGAGISLGEITSPVLQVGAETKLGPNTVLYGGVDYITSSGQGIVAKIGVGYSF
jgi:opacity protein-like surface antigen